MIGAVDEFGGLVFFVDWEHAVGDVGESGSLVVWFDVDFDEVVGMGDGANFFNGEEVGIGLGSGKWGLFVGVGDSETFDFCSFLTLNSNSVRLGHFRQLPKQTSWMAIKGRSVFNSKIMLIFNNGVKKFKRLIHITPHGNGRLNLFQLMAIILIIKIGFGVNLVYKILFRAVGNMLLDECGVVLVAVLNLT